LDALLIKAQLSVDNLQVSGFSQQPQKKKHEWDTAPPSLNIVWKKTIPIHNQFQAAARFRNDLEGNPSLLQQHLGYRYCHRQREQENQTPQKISDKEDARADEIVEKYCKRKGKGAS
jgi:hypothetical protein